MHKSSLKFSALLEGFFFCTVMKPVQLVGYVSYASLSAKLCLIRNVHKIKRLHNKLLTRRSGA